MNKKLLFSLVKNDFKAKYAGSVIGAVWAFINPIITILIYWFVFQVAFQNGPVGDIPYVLWLVSGIVPWFFFSEGWGGVTGVLFDYSYLVKKVVFDVKILPSIRILSALIVHIFFVLLIFIIRFAYGMPLHIMQVQVLYYMAATILLLYGAGRITAVLSAFIKDVGNLVGILVQFGFWLTPIFWNISAIPENLVFIFKLNPVYYIVEGYRNTFAYESWFFSSPLLGIYFWAVVVVLNVIGNILFKKLKPHLADLI